MVRGRQARLLARPGVWRLEALRLQGFQQRGTPRVSVAKLGQVLLEAVRLARCGRKSLAVGEQPGDLRVGRGVGVYQPRLDLGPVQLGRLPRPERCAGLGQLPPPAAGTEPPRRPSGFLDPAVRQVDVDQVATAAVRPAIALNE
jgi:hypothetical protein